jgi:hypothetical protein
MQRFSITAANCGLLALVLIAVPAVASERFWHWQVSSISATQTLMLSGLGFAVASNASAALFLVKGRKERRLCWWWAAVFGALLLAYWALAHGYYNLNWLQRAMQRLQRGL